MERPRPKELVIRHSPGSTTISITATTEDARRWIDREAPSFGTLLRMSDGAVMLLYVNNACDPTEVAAWLNTYVGAEG